MKAWFMLSGVYAGIIFHHLRFHTCIFIYTYMEKHIHVYTYIVYTQHNISMDHHIFVAHTPKFFLMSFVEESEAPDVVKARKRSAIISILLAPWRSNNEMTSLGSDDWFTLYTLPKSDSQVLVTQVFLFSPRVGEKWSMLSWQVIASVQGNFCQKWMGYGSC